MASLRDSHEAYIPGQAEHPAIRALRARSLAWIDEHGLPDKKLEGWRYTSPAKIDRTPFVHDAGELFEALAAPLFHRLSMHDAVAEIVFINGRLALGLSRLGEGVAGLSVVPFTPADVDRAIAPRIDPFGWTPRPNASWGTASPGEVPREQAFDILNSAFIQDGVHITAERGAEIEGTVHVLSITVGEGRPIAAHPRFWVTVAPGASLELVEQHAGAGDQAVLSNVVTDVRVEATGRLVHHVWSERGPQHHHVQHVRAELMRDAQWVGHFVGLGDGWARTDVDVRFVEPGGDVLCTAVQVLTGKGHGDVHTWMRHDAPHGTSRQFARSIAGDQARAVFDGCIHIAKDAQRTHAELVSKNLLMSERAAVFAKPQLEIHADDVTASHGCTIGQLDPLQVDYLRARGIPEAAARRLLTRGFVAEVLAEVSSDTLRSTVEERALAWLEGL
jgi:Fe-S cluster assembly protein SufD